MRQATKIRPGLASPLLALLLVASLIPLAYSRESGGAVEALATLVSMGLAFYLSHPLGHFLTARAYGVGTDYFFIGRSDFRKLKAKPVSALGGLAPTIGTKLNKEGLARLPPRKRGYIFGAGVIFSNALVGVELLYILVAGFAFPAVLLGVLFFLGTVATEILFSTKVGDLGKMSREFKKQGPGGLAQPHSP